MIRFSDELSVSPIVYGWWRLTNWGFSAQDVVKRLEECLTLGVSTHDHADIYGEYGVEEAFGKGLALAPALRDKIQLISKCGIKLVSKNRPSHSRKTYDTTRQHIVTSAEQSLKNLATDYLDVLLIHRPDPLMDVDEIAAAFRQLRRDGKVREFGVSNFSTSQFELLQSRLDFALVTNQLEISVRQHKAFLDGTLDQAQRLRRSPMAWSPLAGGKLFSDDSERAAQLRTCLNTIASQHQCSVEQVAYAWLLHHPARIVPVVGSQQFARIKLAVDAQKIILSREQWFDIWEAAGGALP